MQKVFRKPLAILLSLVMVFTALSAGFVIPAVAADVWSGSYSDSSGFVIDGTTVTISSANGFAYFANQVNNGTTYSGYAVNLTTDIDLANLSFVGIGTHQTAFRGIFDGKNHSVSGVNISITNDYNVGLFREVLSGKISNLTLASGTVHGNMNVGGIVGSAQGQYTVSGCVNHADVICNSDTCGGIVGYAITGNTGNVNNCINYGSISADQGGCGGVVGYVNGALNISDCINYGTVTGGSGTTYYAGGIVGYVQAYTQNITNSVNFGDVSSSGAGAAGILGAVKADTEANIIKCFNYGDITATKEAAGIFGYTTGSVWHYVTSCANFGTIRGIKWSGGISGNCAYTVVNSCFNKGNVSALDGGRTASFGGINGTDGNVKYSYNRGDVTYGYYAGGIFGNDAGYKLYCYNTGNITGATVNKQIVGDDTGSTDICFY